MLLNIILLVVGFVVLIKGADFFVDGASSLATNFKLSKMLIALTIVSFGTSAPEFAVSIQSIMNGSGDIVVGNVIGSNILNILLILGLSSVVHSLTVKNNTVKKEIPIMLLITSLLMVLVGDNLFDKNVSNTITRADGLVVLLFFGVFIYYLISMMRNKTLKDDDDKAQFGIVKSLIFTVVGIVAIILGSHFVVNSATYLAKAIGISERIISLTIIAFGTSLPELVTSVIATKKGEYDIAIGNVVGSNIFNIGIVIGIPTVLFGGTGIITFNAVDLIFFFLSAFLLFIFALPKHKITRGHGVVFLIMFIIYYSYLFIG
ncbi:MAG: calcium/sodium antiporter [Bacilli bacterium]|nr:calcium/sodium antiporter [Bacilli bacterium]